MLPNVAVRAGELLAAGVVALAVTVAAAWWVKRRIRRHLERIGRAMAGLAGGVAAGAARAGWRWLWSRPLPDRRWVAAGRARRRLWRAVSAASHAVAVARQAGAARAAAGGPPGNRVEPLACRRQEGRQTLSIALGVRACERLR
jgi:hypothetical protein